jgi:hypothetical protein
MRAASCIIRARGIKTYTEQVRDEKMITTISNKLKEAEHIVFLGFAYHDQNMQLLFPAERFRYKPMFGTAFGMSDSDVNVVSDQLVGWFDKIPSAAQRSALIKIENKLKCADLFDNYAKSLTG